VDRVPARGVRPRKSQIAGGLACRSRGHASTSGTSLGTGSLAEMSPNMAEGASMALEDALVLTHMLAAQGSPAEALSAFSEQRRARVRVFIPRVSSPCNKEPPRYPVAIAAIALAPNRSSLRRSAKASARPRATQRSQLSWSNLGAGSCVSPGGIALFIWSPSARPTRRLLTLTPRMATAANRTWPAYCAIPRRRLDMAAVAPRV
jgi:hypothetical protein